MGEVYRSRDARLNRDVAIKVLPAVFVRDPDRLRRLHAGGTGRLRSEPSHHSVFTLVQHKAELCAHGHYPSRQGS